MRMLLEEHRGDRLDLVDGIKVLVDSGYVLVIPDADAPYYHVIVSVDDGPRARALLEDYAAQVRRARDVEGAPVASVLEKA